MAKKFTTEETELVKKLMSPTNAKLSDDELESVVGGASLINMEGLFDLACDLTPLAMENSQLQSIMDAFMQQRYADAFRYIGLLSITNPTLFNECMKVVEPYLAF